MFSIFQSLHELLENSFQKAFIAFHLLMYGADESFEQFRSYSTFCFVVIKKHFYLFVAVARFRVSN